MSTLSPKQNLIALMLNTVKERNSMRLWFYIFLSFCIINHRIKRRHCLRNRCISVIGTTCTAHSFMQLSDYHWKPLQCTKPCHESSVAGNKRKIQDRDNERSSNLSTELMAAYHPPRTAGCANTKIVITHEVNQPPREVFSLPH